MLVEEAAEVMEAHILASLAPSTEHLILIGDHEQLRPKVQLYEMQARPQNLDIAFGAKPLNEMAVYYMYSCQTLQQVEMADVCTASTASVCIGVQVESRQGYDLDRSLFERLVIQGHPVATLQQQRRMRPSISSLIRETIYRHLQVTPPVLRL